MNDSTIKSQYTRADSDRQELLERARFCASLTKPWVLPPEDQTSNSKLPETFSSLAARGIANLEGRLLLALFPPGQPFFSLQPASRLQYAPDVDPEQYQTFMAGLHLQELLIQSKLEAADVAGRHNRKRTGFRSRKRTAITQLLITGDVLEHLTDDYRIRVFRRDQYVTLRDSSGDVIYHIVTESVDPLALTGEQRELGDIDTDVVEQKSVDDRMVDMFTKCEWHPITKKWIIQQEINNNIIAESEEDVTPFMSTPYELTPQENYGRGLIETLLGDVRSLNELKEKVLDFAAASSKILWATDTTSQVRPRDLAKPSGSVIQAKVNGGQIMDVGVLSTNKNNDFSVVYQTMLQTRKDLAQAMLMEGESTPTGERVTAYQVSRVAQEREGALGGVYAPIADNQQVPLIDRMIYQMKKDKLFPPLPSDAVEIETLTGISALSREHDQGKLLQTLQILSQFGPQLLERIDTTVLMDLLMRQANIHEPGLVKSEEQIEQERQQAMEQQQQAAGAQEATKVAGDVVRSMATANGQGAA